jgi:hypothetical protein
MTDPRLDKADYLLGPRQSICPHHNLDYIGDINSGYHKDTWAKLVTDPDKQILVPTPLYLDGCVTGQFANLIAQFKMTIGIINQKARDKAYFGEILP